MRLPRRPTFDDPFGASQVASGCTKIRKNGGCCWLGWYAGATRADTDDWKVQLFRYDNDANASAHDDGYFAWHTDFWDAGLSRTHNAFTVLAQGAAMR